MQKLATSAEMSALDQGAIKAGVPGLILMENAGRGTFRAIEEHLLAHDHVRHSVIVCGKGNNGGDGFVIGRHLLNAGVPAEAFLLGRMRELKGDAAANAEAYIATGGKLTELVSPAGLGRLTEALNASDLVVDALFGTGLNSGITGLAAKAIGAINESGAFVCAVDIPSGISADTGAVLGTAVVADLTVTYGLEKPGHYLEPGRSHRGLLLLERIPIPAADIVRYRPSFELITPSAGLWDYEIRNRSDDSHKGNYGHVMVLAGSHGKSGAAVLAARGAHGGGAGLVTVVCPKSLEPVVAGDLRETMTLLLPENPAGGWAPESSKAVLTFLSEKHVLVTGPGIPTDKTSEQVLLEILKKAPCPVVVDADALNVLARQKTPLRLKNAVLTPHPGEAARLLGLTNAEIQSDRAAAVRDLARNFGCTVVLKGASSLVTAPGKPVRINPTGTPAMATGGMGDLLAGLIGGLIASTGLDPFEAASRAVWLHGRAGEIAAERAKRPSVLASEVWQALGDAYEQAFS